MRVFSSVIDPAVCFLADSISYDHHHWAVRTQFVRYCNSKLAIALHWFIYEFQSGVAITSFAYVAFQNFTFMIYRMPKIVPFTLDLHENLIKVPLPIRMTACLLSSFLRNLWCKHWPEAIPPKPDCFMANVDAPFMQKVLHMTERKRETNLYHYCKLDDFRASFKLAK